MPRGEYKLCLKCGEKMIRKTIGEQQWELQKTHQECRSAYDKEQNAAGIIERASRRYFKRNGKRVRAKDVMNFSWEGR